MSTDRVRRVAVVGGGAAGLITGLTLRAMRNPPEVVVFEREKAPYTTLCGEGISQRALNAFRAFDSLPHTSERFPGAEWHFPGGIKINIDQTCYSLERSTWIPAMAEAFVEMGGDYRTNSRINPDQVPDLKAEYDLVVGADGPGSMVAKSINARHVTSLGIQYRMERGDFDSDRLEFYTDKRFSPEYSWVFPKGDILNVGLLAAGSTSPRVEGAADSPATAPTAGKPRSSGLQGDWDRLDEFVQWRGLETKVLKREAYPIGFNGTVFQHENIVLIGDAAGLTNPVTKGGMAAIIHAANLLADLVSRGLHHRYGVVLSRHPLASPLFRRAEAAIVRWTNEDFERVARFAPPVMTVGGPTSAYLRYGVPLAMSLAMNPRLAPDLSVIARAMGLAKDWSW